MEPGFLERVSEQRRTVDTLEASLAPRHQAELAELDTLEKQLATLTARAEQLPAETARLEEANRRAEVERAALAEGLTRARRAWLKLFDPVLGAMLLFFCIVDVGLEEKERLAALVLEACGLGAGIVLSRVLRRFRVGP